MAGRVDWTAILRTTRPADSRRTRLRARAAQSIEGKGLNGGPSRQQLQDIAITWHHLPKNLERGSMRRS